MVEPQASRFWQAALRSDLVSAADLEAWWQSIPDEKRTAEHVDRYLARRAVQVGKLTLWQAQQLFNGRWQGLRLGRYVLQDLLGQGGMGRVYLADDTQLGRLVALKILARQRTNNPRAVARFDREVRVGAKLQHENLIRIYDAGTQFGLRYLVMEYVDGKTIYRILQEQIRLAPEIAAELARQVLLGLEHLHEKGLLHRDVNPSNILVNQAGTAKLTDLGLALDLDDPEVLTRDGAAVGTFDYIAPEQARDPRSVDIRCDIYALGCTLYHMIAGQVPFPGLNPGERIMAHQFADPTPLEEVAPDCPPGLIAIVEWMMRKAPEDRPSTPREAAQALIPWASGPVPLDRLGPGTGRAPIPKPPQSRHESEHDKEAAAVAAEWFDSDAEFAQIQPPAGGPILGTPDSADVFVREELAPEAETGWAGRITAWHPAAMLVGFAVLLVLLAAILGRLAWN